MNKITYSQALVGYDISANSRHLSKNTLADYHNTFRKFQSFLKVDVPFQDITKETIEKFLGSLRLKKKTVLNYHTGLSALWEWAFKEKLVPENLLHSITRPDPERPDIIPLSESDVRLILSMISQSKPYTTHGVMASHTIHNAIRNRAIILTLLDTGLRVSELCDLLIRDVDMRNSAKFIKILGGKGGKDRHFPISARTAQALWRYLSDRPDARLTDPLFVTKNNNRVDRTNIYDMLEYAGKRAGVSQCNPHRFRHTFAINFLRNGGNVFSLQAILGHESLDTCKKYLMIAEADVDAAHRLASPVDHWRL
jgi:site-specific recombinase XerD